MTFTITKQQQKQQQQSKKAMAKISLGQQ